MMMCIDRKLRLFNDKPSEHKDSDLIDEILKLQVSQFSKNIIKVEAPKLKGNYDDRSDAIVRSVWLATEAMRKGMVSSSAARARSRNIPPMNASQYRARKSRFHNIHDTRRNPGLANKRRW